MAKKPPTFKIPPAPAKKGVTSTRSVYERYIGAHSGLKQWSQQIWNAATSWGLDPVYFASLINFESGGNNRNGQPNSAGAIGLGQVEPGKYVPWLGRTVTAADLANPVTNLGVSAWYFHQGYQKYGNYSDAYTKYYNPGYGPKGNGYAGPVFTDVPKGYVVAGGSTSPEQKANTAAATAQAKAAQPALQQSAASQFLDPIYLAYAGRRATGQEVRNYVSDPVSAYQLQLELSQPSNNPRIFKSPIWLTHAPAYEAMYKSMYGQNAKIDKNTLLYGIVHNLDATAFQQALRDGKIPGQAPYTGSEEFKGNLADATSVYAQIYGKPDPKATTFLKSAVLGGWNQAQLESYLRSQPEYRSSGEYKTRALSLSAQMGLISSDMAKSIGQTALGPSPQPNLPVATQPAATTPAAAPEKKVPVTPGATPAPENAGGVLSG